jgi:zinc transport system substrate-binding protein
VLKADAPNVVADIAPVHSLVSLVMKGIGQPQMLIPQNASPHHYAMRPSEAKALQEANLVVYLGEDLTPWLEPLFETVAASAEPLDLSEVDGVLRLSYREGPVFGEQKGHDDHDDHEGHDHEKEGHDDHEGYDHEKGGHDDHDDHEGRDDHAHHDHDGNDPHMWLDPTNALVWLDAIASELGHIDPKNAARYRANAKMAKEEISHEIHHIEDRLKSVKGEPFLVFHDAYQYFENRFGIFATGSIALSDASKPSAKRLQQLKHHFEEEGIHCVLSEPQYPSELIDSVFGGFEPHIGVVDPIGVDLELGFGLYLQLLENVALGIAQCVNH